MWKPVKQSHVLRNWAMAELANPRWAPKLVDVPWPPGSKAKMEAGQWNTLTEQEWEFMEEILTQHLRRPLLTPLLPLQPEWYLEDFPIEAVAEIRFMKLQPWVSKVPGSRRLADLAEAERGEHTGRPEFIRASMVGLPIAVGQSLAGPFTLVEGYTRCCRALRDQNIGLYDGLPIPMVVGVTERIQEWAWW